MLSASGSEIFISAVSSSIASQWDRLFRDGNITTFNAGKDSNNEQSIKFVLLKSKILKCLHFFRNKKSVISACGSINVSRLSINPQTLNEKTLKLIGREHSVDMFLNVYELARKVGHKHINTDIILGLPEEGEKEVIATLEGLEKLSPESITVHTLAVKRASRLKETLENYSMTEAEKMDKLINISREYTEKMDMLPYYMYRQKNMVGNFENVGYCKENCQCIYNVAIMEEKQSILALGAGASTKLLLREKNQIERVFNVKSVDDYINRIDEMIERKNSAIKGVLPV